MFAAARTLLPVLETKRALDAATLRDAMTEAFGNSDSAGAWLWKDAYEAAEAACVLFFPGSVLPAPAWRYSQTTPSPSPSRMKR